MDREEDQMPGRYDIEIAEMALRKTQEQIAAKKAQIERVKNGGVKQSAEQKEDDNG